MLDRLYQVAIAACLYRTILGLWVPVSLRRNKRTVLLIVCQDWLGNELWSATLLPPPDRNDITGIHSGGVHWYRKKTESRARSKPALELGLSMASRIKIRRYPLIPQLSG